MAEEVFDCVQCGVRYLEIENQVLGGACAFHPEHNWERYPRCCGSYNPCKKGAHRPKHHCDYRYGNFFAMVAAINNYTDTKTEWGEAQDTHLTSDHKQLARCGKLLRWKSRADLISDDLLVVQVGGVSDPSYWFHIYDTKELDEIGKAGKTEIFRTSESNTSYSYAKWIITDGILSGIHLEAMETTSSSPSIVVVNFTPFPLEMVGEAVVVSEGGIKLFNPSSKYNLPVPFVDTSLEIKQSPGAVDITTKNRKPRKDFPTQGELNMRVKAGEIKANANRKSNSNDNFAGVLNLINVNRGKEAEPIVITDVICEWRYAGEKEWKDVDSIEVERNFSLHPMLNTELSYYVILNDSTKCVGWFNRAWIGRNQPIRFKFTFEDVEGNRAYQIVEYVFNPPDQYGKEKDDLLFLFVDDPIQYERRIFRGKNVLRDDYPDGDIISVGDGTCFREPALTALVFKAKEEGNYEQLLWERKGSSDSEGTSTAYALIDANTNRVYAVKGIVQTPFGAAMGYWEVPLYGQKPNSEERPISPVTEKIGLPTDVTPYVTKTYAQDDDFDDALIPCKKIITGGPSSVSLDQNSLETINKLNENMQKMSSALERFESVDQGISRLADSFEKLVVILSNKK